MNQRLCLSLFVAFCAASFPTSVSRAQIVVGNPGLTAALGNSDQVSASWYGYIFNGDMNEAIQREKKKLRPGESKSYGVVAYGRKELAGQYPLFHSLFPADDGAIIGPGYYIWGYITIRSNRSPLVFVPSTPVDIEPPRESFEQWRKNFAKDEVDFADFTVACNSILNLNGSGRIDITKREVFAPFAGTVILIAQSSESDYGVFNVKSDSKDPKRYDKGATLKALGTTVWILSEDRKYVAVLAQLGKTDATLGQRVEAGKTRLGAWKDEEKEPFQLYRVRNSSQYFLNGDDPKPTRLLPVK